MRHILLCVFLVSASALAQSLFTTQRFAFQGRVTGVAAGAHNMVFSFSGGSGSASTAPMSITVNADGSFSAVINDPAIVASLFQGAGPNPNLVVSIDVDSGAHVFSNVPITAVPAAFVAQKALSLDAMASITPSQIAGPLTAGQIPMLDGSKITDGSLSSADLNGTGVTPGTYGSATQVPVFTVDAAGRISNVSNTTISGGAGTVTSITPGVGFTSGTPITGVGTLDIDVGVGPSKIVQLDASGFLPALNGSLLSNVNAVALQTRPVAAAPPTMNDVLSWNGSMWTPTAGGISASGGSMSGALIMSGSATAGSPALRFTDMSSNVGFYVPASTNALAYASGGTERFRLTSNGYFGIGTNAPTGILDVNGGIHPSGTATNITLKAQDAGGANFDGGHITLTAGLKTGSGSNGAVQLTGARVGMTVPGSVGSTVIGTNAALTMTGSNNTIVGSGAGMNIGTGMQNTYIGKSVAPSATSSANTVVGYASLSSATGGAGNNIVIGANAGTGITSGGSNILIGNGVDTSGPTASNEIVIGTPMHSAPKILGNLMIFAVKNATSSGGSVSANTCSDSTTVNIAGLPASGPSLGITVSCAPSNTAAPPANMIWSCYATNAGNTVAIRICNNLNTGGAVTVPSNWDVTATVIN